MRAGDRFANLVAMNKLGHQINGLWLFQCDCGKHQIISRSRIRLGHYGECDGDCTNWTIIGESPQVEGLSVEEVARCYMVPIKTLRRRFEIGWSVERAVITPVHGRDHE